MTAEVITLRTTDQGKIGLRFTVGRGDRRLTPTVPALAEPGSQDPVMDPGNQRVVGWISRHLGNDPSFQQFHVVIFSQDPGPDHLVVLIHSETANRNGRNDRRKSWNQCARRHQDAPRSCKLDRRPHSDMPSIERESSANDHSECPDLRQQRPERPLSSGGRFRSWATASFPGAHPGLASTCPPLRTSLLKNSFAGKRKRDRGTGKRKRDRSEVRSGTRPEVRSGTGPWSEAGQV